MFIIVWLGEVCSFYEALHGPNQLWAMENEVEEKVANICDDPAELQRVLNIQIDTLGLPKPLVKRLQEAGIRFVGELTQKEKGEIAAINRVGKKSIKLIEKALAELDLSFGIRLSAVWSRPL